MSVTRTGVFGPNFLKLRVLEKSPVGVSDVNL